MKVDLNRRYCSCPHCGNVFILLMKPFKRIPIPVEEGVAARLADLVKRHNQYLCSVCFEEWKKRTKAASNAVSYAQEVINDVLASDDEP